MAQPKTQQRTPQRLGMNREQARRGALATPAGGRTPAPIPAAGGRGRRGTPNVIGFVRDVRSELRKVVWPTPRETMNLTAVVLSLSVAVSLFLGFFELAFQELFRFLIALGGGSGF